MDAKHLVAIKPAQQGGAGELLDQFLHQRLGGADQRIAGADPVVEFDNARPKRVADARKRGQQPGIREHFQISVESRPAIAQYRV